MPPPRTIELTDPLALRALAHPVRLALVGLLRREGPLTATQAGEKLGESPTTCSFHLRQLARYGLVEEAGGGRGRRRPWRATAMFTAWPGAASDPDVAAASDALRGVIARRLFEQVQAWLARRPHDTPEWQEAADFGDAMLYLTAEELTELRRRIDEFLEPFLERHWDATLRPEGARRVTFLRLAFPVDTD